MKHQTVPYIRGETRHRSTRRAFCTAPWFTLTAGFQERERTNERMHYLLARSPRTHSNITDKWLEIPLNMVVINKKNKNQIHKTFSCHVFHHHWIKIHWNALNECKCVIVWSIPHKSKSNESTMSLNINKGQKMRGIFSNLSRVGIWGASRSKCLFLLAGLAV